MRRLIFLLFITQLFFGCKSQQLAQNFKKKIPNSQDATITIAFGSCNKVEKENVFWDDILTTSPNVFVWGGDNIYADTEDMDKLKAMYAAQNSLPAYAALKKSVFVTGTWDDHDYGLNDGGVEFSKKRESQQLFLDFMGVPQEDPRRYREGVYSSHVLSIPEGEVKIINLDTRFFRTPLTESKRKGVRYLPNEYGDGTILGEDQWQWLKKELMDSETDFNIVVSSIQFLSKEHGFEKWANHPHEVDKMIQLIKNTKAKGVIFLSGDRHISEFSKMEDKTLSYPLIDFTSSGLTHSYSSYKGEPNAYRVGEVVSTTSFGLVQINLETKEVAFRIMGDNAEVYQELKQQY